MASPANVIVKAADFAAGKHRVQRRSDTSLTPYINHPLGVAQLLSSVAGVETTDVLVAAILHDTVEDTDCTLDEIEREFGLVVRNIVAEVTDNKTLTKVERKRQQIKHAPHMSHEAKLVKLADKLHNLRAQTTSPPADWNLARRQGYFHWSAAVVQGLRGTNAALEAELDKLFTSGTIVVDGHLAIERVPCCPGFGTDDSRRLLEEYLCMIVATTGANTPYSCSVGMSLLDPYY
jgi:guanosine-3',5'-bis(diphosphate) 3'-pyrophosphohydrolase